MKALPELVSAGLLFWLWLDPMRFGIEWFRSGVLTLMLEFFVVHSAGFMSVFMFDPESPPRKRMLLVAGLGVFYLLFISGFAWGFDAWWMLWVFAWLCFSKIQAIWHGGEPEERDRMAAMAGWAFSVAVFLGSVGASVMLDFPRLGVTDAIRDAARFDANGGVWEAEPHRALAGAVVYFIIMGLSRPLFARWQSR